MSKKAISVFTLIITICLILLGVMCRFVADNNRGTQLRTGVVIDGELRELTAGHVGKDQETYETYYVGGTILFVLSGVTGVMSVIAFILHKKSE